VTKKDSWIFQTPLNVWTVKDLNIVTNVNSHISFPTELVAKLELIIPVLNVKLVPIIVSLASERQTYNVLVVTLDLDLNKMTALIKLLEVVSPKQKVFIQFVHKK
jgi:hypothetical protein